MSPASDGLTLTVNNLPPKAEASGNSSQSRGQKAYLGELNSRDPDGDSFTCSWAKTGGTHTGDVELTNPKACNLSTYFVVPSTAVIGHTLVFTLTVSDGKGGVDTDEWTVSVNNIAPSRTRARLRASRRRWRSRRRALSRASRRRGGGRGA